MADRPQKITFAGMRDTAVRADAWPDDVRLSDIEDKFVFSACCKRGADVRPDFNWNKPVVPMVGYR